MILKRIGLFQKLLMFFILVSVIPIIIIGYISFNFFSRQQMDSLIKLSDDNILKINDNINSLIEKYSLIMEALCRDTDILEAISKDSTEYISYDIQKKLDLMLADKKNKIEIHIIGSNGNTNFSTGQIPNIYNYQVYKDWGIYRKVKETTRGGVAIKAHKFSNISGESVVLSLAREMTDSGGNTAGYVIIDIYRNQIAEILTENNILSMDLLIMGIDNTVIFDSKAQYLEGLLNNQEHVVKIMEKEEGYEFEDINNRKWLVTHKISRNFHFITIGFVPVDIVIKNIELIRIITIVTSVLSLFVCISVAFFISRNISKPVKAMVSSMKQVEKGDLAVRVNYKSWDEIAVLGERFNMMVIKIKELLDKVVEGQERLRIAEIEALQAQINPHFLYNTLNAVKSLAKLNQNQEICNVITQLGKLLRSNIESNAEFRTVEENLQLINSYLYIQNVRHNKFTVEINVEKTIFSCRIPKLILQPIVENSVIHGLEKKERPGKLIINGWRDKTDLVFEVIDNGVGMDEELARRINSGKIGDSGLSDSIGIKNVQKRIKLYYGEQYGLHVESVKDKGTRVTLRVQYMSE